MGKLLSQVATNFLPVLHPDLPSIAVKYYESHAAWVKEYDTPWPQRGKDPVTHVDKIDETRLSTPFSREGLVKAFPKFNKGLWPYEQDRENPAVKRQIRRLVDPLDDALEAARRYGVIRSRYTENADGEKNNHPFNELVDIVGCALAREAARRDVIEHLRRHPLTGPVHIDGVDVHAKPLHGRSRAERQWERTVEIHEPTTPEADTAVLLRKVELEFSARLGVVRHPEWRPTGREAAGELRALAGRLTGVPVVTTPTPRLVWNGARPVVNDEILDLLPVLRHMPPGTTTTEPPKDAGSAPEGRVAEVKEFRAKKTGKSGGSWADMEAEALDQSAS